MIVKDCKIKKRESCAQCYTFHSFQEKLTTKYKHATENIITCYAVKLIFFAFEILIKSKLKLLLTLNNFILSSSIQKVNKIVLL